MNWVENYLEQNPELGRDIVRRDRCALHLKQTDGSVVGLFTPVQQHYWHRTRGWVPLDTCLMPVAGGYGVSGLPFTLTTTGGVIIGTFTQQSRGVALYSREGKRSPVAAFGQHALDCDSLRYQIGPYAHYLRMLHGGLEETLVLGSAPEGEVGDLFALETEDRGPNLPDGPLGEAPPIAGFARPMPTGWDALGNVAPMSRFVRHEGSRQLVCTAVPLSWLARAAYPVTLDPDFAGSATWGEVSGVSGTYSTARSTSTASSVVTHRVGQDHGNLGGGGQYTVLRYFTKFDTSSIGSATALSTVTLGMAMQSDNSTTDFDIEIAKEDWSAQDPIGAGNREAAYDNCLSATLDQVWRNTSGIAANTRYFSPNLDTTWVSKTGSTYYGVRSAHDSGNTAPANNTSEYITLIAANNGSFGHILRVVYVASDPVMGAPPIYSQMMARTG